MKITVDEYKASLNKKIKTPKNKYTPISEIKKYCTKDSNYDLNSLKEYLSENYNIKLIKHVFFVNPKAAPRMTQSDKWKTNPFHVDESKRQRKTVAEYFAFKNEFIKQCEEQCYDLTEILDIIFVVPIAESKSQKKRKEMMFTKHQIKPDRDNYLKAVQDSFTGDDGFVYDGRTLKIWGEIGLILIF